MTHQSTRYSKTKDDLIYRLITYSLSFIREQARNAVKLLDLQRPVL